MENQVYRVARTRIGSQVELALKDFPGKKVTAKSTEDAEEKLLDLICQAFGDGEPVLDFFEEPNTLNASTRTELWCFRSNEKSLTLNFSELYDGRVCSSCGAGQGLRRTNVCRRIDRKLKTDVAFTISGPSLTLIFSERLISLLIGHGVPPSLIAPVVDGDGKRFAEVLPSGDIDWVPVKKTRAVRVGAQKCRQCCFSSFGFVDLIEKDMRRFIAEADLLALKSDASIVGLREPEPILKPAARESIRADKEIKGFIWGRVGLASLADLETKLKYDPFPRLK